MVRLLIVIPAFNEVQTIRHVIQGIPRKIDGIDTVDILVVDDGSTDETHKAAAKTGVRIVTHIMNRGLGAALGTAFEYARNKKYDFLVTFDADGQHNPADITEVVSSLVHQRAEVVIGSRLLKGKDMPIMRKAVNQVSNIITWMLFGIWTSDSQSGFRGFSGKALEKIQIRSQHMEVSSEIFKEIARLELKTIEVPITCIYTEYSLMKGQRLQNAPNVFFKLMLHRFG